MFRLTILYGYPTNPPEFERYYREVHLPLARRMVGLRGWTMNWLEPDASGHAPDYYLVVDLYAASLEEMNDILASPEGKAASEDVGNFATGGVTYLFGQEEVVLPVVNVSSGQAK